MIHTTQITELATESQSINLKFIDSTGEKISIEGCSVTSVSFNNKTINVRIPESGEVRTIRTITVVEFNGQEVSR